MPRRGRQGHGPEHGAVTTEADGQVDVVPVQTGVVDGIDHLGHGVPARRQPRARPGGQLGGDGTFGMDDEGDRDHRGLSPPGAPGTAPPDAGSADAGSADAGSADAGSADAGSADAGSSDPESTDATSGEDAMAASRAASRSKPGGGCGGPVRAHRRYSAFPAGPRTGDAMAPMMLAPAPTSAEATLSRAARRSSWSRTTPRPRLTATWPTSNCGLTRTTRSAPGAARATSVGTTAVREMNDEVGHDEPERFVSVAGVQAPHVRPLADSRRADRHAGADGVVRSRRRPPSHRPLPVWRRQSVKPPVDAPASRQRRSTTTTGKRSSAAASLSPPRETKQATGAVDDDGVSPGDQT